MFSCGCTQLHKSDTQNEAMKWHKQRFNKWYNVSSNCSRNESAGDDAAAADHYHLKWKQQQHKSVITVILARTIVLLFKYQSLCLFNAIVWLEPMYN